MAAPMPEPAPVTTATLPSKSGVAEVTEIRIQNPKSPEQELYTSLMHSTLCGLRRLRVSHKACYS
jgi:hypothetical protein